MDQLHYEPASDHCAILTCLLAEPEALTVFLAPNKIFNSVARFTVLFVRLAPLLIKKFHYALKRKAQPCVSRAISEK